MKSAVPSDPYIGLFQGGEKWLDMYMNFSTNGRNTTTICRKIHVHQEIVRVYDRYIFMSSKDRYLVVSIYCQLNLPSTPRRCKLYALYTKAKMINFIVVKPTNDNNL